MENLIEKLETLENVCADIYNIITRSDWTCGEMVELCDYVRVFDNALIDAVSNGNANKLIDVLYPKGVADYAPRYYLERVERTKDFYEAWILSIKYCEFGTRTDLTNPRLIEYLRDSFSDSLNEIRATLIVCKESFAKTKIENVGKGE